MSKSQFTGTVTHPQCNRKFCQFYKDQYCNDKCRINGVTYLDNVNNISFVFPQLCLS